MRSRCRLFRAVLREQLEVEDRETRRPGEQEPGDEALTASSGRQVRRCLRPPSALKEPVLPVVCRGAGRSSQGGFILGCADTYSVRVAGASAGQKSRARRGRSKSGAPTGGTRQSQPINESAWPSKPTLSSPPLTGHPPRYSDARFVRAQTALFPTHTTYSSNMPAKAKAKKPAPRPGNPRPARPQNTSTSSAGRRMATAR